MAVPRPDLPANRALRRDIQLLERFYGAGRVFWPMSGEWIRVVAWALPQRPTRYNHKTTDVLIMVPPAYGEVAGKAAGLEEFYVRPDLQLRRGETWADLPHSFSTLDRREGKALAQGWRYLCVHTIWDPRRDNAMTAMTQLGLVLSDPFAFERLAYGNGRTA